MMRRFFLCVACLFLTGLPVGPAHALFGLGDVVYDPANHAENILTAAQTLQQVNNQVLQLANEAQMLLNQARDLAVLPDSAAGELQTSLAEIDTLLRSARGLAYDVEDIDRMYQRLFPEEYTAAIGASGIDADAREAWLLARDGLRRSLEVQAAVTTQLRADATTLDRLLADSQAAAGNLQASQAGNQLTALAAKQTMQLQSLLAAEARAEALWRADTVAERERARARFANFTSGEAYPGR